MTRQVTDQLYIDLGYHTPEEYYVYTAEAQSQQAVSSTLSCDAGKITQAQADMVVTTVITATISHIEGADLFAFSESQLAAQVDRIRDNNIETSTVFAVSTEVSRIRSLVADQFAISDITVINERSRAFIIETQAAFSLVAETSSIELASADLVSTITLTSLESVTKGFIAQLDLTSAAVIDIARTRDFDSNQSVTTETSALGTATKDAIASLNNTTELQCIISHIEGADLQAFGDSQVTADADVIAYGLVSLITESTTTVDGQRIRYADSNQQSESSVVASIDGTIEAQISLSITSTVAADAQRTRPADSNLSVETTAVIDVQRNRFTESNLVSTSDISCTISHIEGADLSAFGQAAISIQPNVIRSAVGSLISTSNSVIALSATRRNSSSIQSTSNIIVGKWVGSTRPNNVNVQTSSVDIWGTYPTTTGYPTGPKYGAGMARVGNISGGGSLASIVTNDVIIRAGENFLLEMWVWAIGAGASNAQPSIAGVGVTTSTLNSPSTTQFSWGIGCTFVGNLQYKYNNNGTIVTVASTTKLGSVSQATNEWTHLAFYRYNGNTLALAKNGVEVATSSFSGEFRIPNTSTNRRFWIANGSNSYLFVDDVHLRIAPSGYGNFGISNFNSPAQNDPNSSVLYWPLNERDGSGSLVFATSDYLGVNEVGSASLSQISTLTATISGPQRSSAALQVISTATIQAQKAAEIILSAFGDSQTTIDGVRVRYSESALAVTSNISALNQTVKTTDAALVLDFQQSATANITASAEITVSGTTVSLTATARTRSGDIQANVESQMVTDAIITASAQAQIESTSAISIPGERIRYADSSQNTETVIAADLGLIKRFVSDLQSQTVQTVDAVKTVSAVANIEGITISVTALGAIRQGLIPMSIESALAADGVITANGVANVQSTTDAVINGIIKVEFDADLAATTQVQADNLRVRYSDVALAVETAQNADINYTAFGESQQASTTAISATASGTIDFAVVIQATSTAVISANRFRDNIVTAVADSAVVANNVRTRDNSVANTSDVVLTAQSARTRPFDAQLVANTIDLFVAVKTGQALADMAVNSQVQATVNIIAYGLVPLAIEVQSSITAVKRSNVNLNFIAQFVQIAEGTTNVLAEADLVTETNLSASATVIYSGAMAAATDTDLTATGVARRGFAFLDQSSGTMTVTADRIRNFSSNFASVSIDLIIGDRVVSFNVAMTATTALTAQGRDIDLAKYVYVIPVEIRTWTIAEENRTRVIKEETRIYKIRRF